MVALIGTGTVYTTTDGLIPSHIRASTKYERSTDKLGQAGSMTQGKGPTTFPTYCKQSKSTEATQVGPLVLPHSDTEMPTRKHLATLHSHSILNQK